MALISQNTLFDRLKEYIDLKIDALFVLSQNCPGEGVGGGQFYGTTAVKAIQYMAKTIEDNEIVIAEDKNAFAVDSVIIEDGGSIILHDGAVFKVL